MEKSYKINAKLLLYSQSSETGQRIATFVLTIPKFIQAQINSHRALSRNANSSRATPAKVLRKRVLYTPYIPIQFSSKKSGMRGGDELSGMRLFLVRKLWLWSRFLPCLFHYLAEKIGLHKEIVNRIIEPWMWTQVVATATEWKNFIKLRTNNNAQPEIQIIAKNIETALDRERPKILKTGEWHLPFIGQDEFGKYDIEILKKISVARCAHISYKLNGGTQSSAEKNVTLCNRLINDGHWSPFEHVAIVLSTTERCGNFLGFKQYRKFFESENGGDYEKR